MLPQPPRGSGKSRRGHIIAMSSGAGRRGLPLFGVYAMTKAAQLSLCEAMRVELLPRGVYVSSVHPLTTATEFFEQASRRSRYRSSGFGRAQSAETVARKVVASSAAHDPNCGPSSAAAWMLALAAALPRLTDWSMSRTIGRHAP